MNRSELLCILFGCLGQKSHIGGARGGRNRVIFGQASEAMEGKFWCQLKTIY
jgi:hypothetical protein